ncbi:hypothetical protein TNCV_1691751 [Trichonephila clavipes]|nr:hypothetical protein TNCV_1691751 [Trichonephila clavipes]
MRAIGGKRHDILGMPAIITACNLVQNSKFHYEALRTNASDRSRGGGEHTIYCLGLGKSWTSIANNAKSPPGGAIAYQLLHRSINRQVANVVAKKDANLALSSTFRYVSIESPL